MSTNDPNTPAPSSHPPDEPSGSLAPASGGRLTGLPVSSWSSSAPQRPEILASGANASDLWNAFRRRLAQAVGSGLVLASIAAAVVWFTVPIKYQVAATLKVSNQDQRIMPRTGGQDTDFSTYKRTQNAHPQPLCAYRHAPQTGNIATADHSEGTGRPSRLAGSESGCRVSERSRNLEDLHGAATSRIS